MSCAICVMFELSKPVCCEFHNAIHCMRANLHGSESGRRTAKGVPSRINSEAPVLHRFCRATIHHTRGHFPLLPGRHNLSCVVHGASPATATAMARQVRGIEVSFSPHEAPRPQQLAVANAVIKACDSVSYHSLHACAIAGRAGATGFTTACHRSATAP